MEHFDPERYANDNYDEETLAEINKVIIESNGISEFIDSLKEKSLTL